MILIPLLVVLDDRCVWSVGVETWSVGRASESVGRWSVVVGGSEVQQLLLVRGTVLQDSDSYFDVSA